MLKRFIIAIIALVIVVGGIVGFNLFRDNMIAQFFANRQPAAVPVTVSDVVPGPWTPGIEAIGTASAFQGADLSTEASGVVREILFKANDQITSGQLLVQIDDLQERADLESAKATLNLAQVTLKRSRSLQQRGVSSVSSLDSAEAEEVSAQAQVAKLDAVLRTKQLHAPFDGTIGIAAIEVGQYVTPGTVFATLQDRSQMRVDFNLTEQDVIKVRQGYTVTATSEQSGASITGEVTGINPKIDPNSRLVMVRAVLPDAGDQLTPGQFLRVRVNLPAEPDIIALPQTVVVTSLYGDSVYVARQETPEGAKEPVTVAKQVFVKLGRRFNDQIEITDGLKVGDQVINAGQNRLNSGAVVKIVDDVAQAAQPRTAN